jgi:hypothetical protein
MNNFEDLKRKISEFPRSKDDLTRSYKSKTPLPKNPIKSKSKKPSIRKTHQKSSSPKKDQSKLHKRNSNDFHELSSELLKRTKTKGSKSVELFNHVQESRRPVPIKPLISKPKPKRHEKSEKSEKPLKTWKIRKNSEKNKKKSSSPSDFKSKDKNLDDLVNIQNLLKNFSKRKKPSNKKKSQRSVLKESKNLPTEKNSEKRPKLEIFQNEDLENHQVKLDWLQDSKLSDSLEIFSDIHQDNIVDESEVIPKNFSFINTENLKNEEKSLQRRLSRSFEVSGKQVEFIAYEADSQEKSYFEASRSEYRVLSICHQSSLQITPRKLRAFSITRSFFSIPPKKKVKNSIESQSQISCDPSKQVLSVIGQKIFILPNKPLNLNHEKSFSILPGFSQNIQNLSSQVSEELTSNINTLFIIEQLKNLELFSNSMLEPHISPSLCFKFKQFIESKYLSVIHFLQPGIEFRVSQFLSSLDSEATTEFLRKSQKKKEEVKNLLNDLTVPDFTQLGVTGESDRFFRCSGKMTAEAGSQVFSESSEEESSTDEELRALGISNFESIKSNITVSPVSSENPKLVHLELKLVECELAKQVEEGFKGELEKNFFDNSTLFKYIQSVLMSLDGKKVIRALASPLARDPCFELDKIQDLQIGTFTDLQIRTFDHVFDYSEALKLPLVEASSEIRDNQTEKIEKSFKIMALDNLNNFFQQFRPFGYQGKPLPWIGKKKYEGRVENIQQVFAKVLNDFEFFAAFCLGKVDESLMASEDKMMRGRVTEKKINRLLEFEIPDEEERWTDYDFEETQVKIDLADVVLYELVAEVIDINVN